MRNKRNKLKFVMDKWHLSYCCAADSHPLLLLLRVENEKRRERISRICLASSSPLLLKHKVKHMCRHTIKLLNQIWSFLFPRTKIRKKKQDTKSQQRHDIMKALIITIMKENKKKIMKKLINFPNRTFIKRIFYSVFLFSDLNAIWYNTICSNGALVCWWRSSSILYVAENRTNDLSQRISRSRSLQTFSEKINNLNRSDPIEWKLQKQMFPISLRMYIDDVEYMRWWWKYIVCRRKI